ncbi:MAG: magnesium and cobalt transport protein CorA [Mycobacterium sp.]
MSLGRAVQPTVLDVLSVRVEEPAVAPVEQAVVDCAIYSDGVRLDGSHDFNEALLQVRQMNNEGRKAFVWLGLREPSDHQMAPVAEAFGLHPIAVEDCVHAQQRPKVERYDDTLFVVLKTVHYVPHESVQTARRIAETGEIMVFVGQDFVVAVRHGDHSGLAGLRRELEGEQVQLRLGPHGVLQAITRHVAEGFLEVTGPLEADIDAVEEQTFSTESSTEIEQIYLLKRDVLQLRKAIGPLGTVLETLTTDDADLLPSEVRRYMRDVLDHQAHAADQIVSYDEVLSDLVEAGLARAHLQQNVDMRKISAWVAIAAVPTMIAAIYGMNFEDMPELAWRWGYPAVLAVIASVCAVLYATFRRNHWL